MMRFIHLIVVAALVAAAVDVYKIKFESTVQAERVAKLRVEIRREHEAIAALRAEWAQLDTPARIQALAQRHLTIKQIDPTQVDTLDRLPERPPAPVAPPPFEETATMVDTIEPDFPTGSTSEPAEISPGVKVVP
jgi:cell division protein FtsL